MADVIIETSTLINFLRINRVDLLAGLVAYRFLVTDHVRAEVTTHYPAQLANLESALQAGHLSEVSVTDPAELAVFAAMQALRVLGDGECSAIAAASVRKIPIAIDDIRARKEAQAHDPAMCLLDTVGLMVEAIQAGVLTVAEADAIKADWEKHHRFAKKHFTSFSQLIP
jgi:predicted nucleic acid-binding protein